MAIGLHLSAGNILLNCTLVMHITVLIVTIFYISLGNIRSANMMMTIMIIIVQEVNCS